MTDQCETLHTLLPSSRRWEARSRFALELILLPLGVLLLGLAARLHHIGAMPYWLDEVTTVQRSSLPLHAMVRDSLTAHHLPSYFWIASLFGKFGLGESVLRLPSALFGGASAAAVYFVARALGGWRAGLAAGLLMAFSPLQVQYGQEARSYTFVILMMAIGLLGLVLMAKDPVAVSRPRGAADARLLPWALYALGTIGALQVLSTAFFWVISANCAAIVIAAEAGEGRQRFLRRWLFVQALTALSILPWFLAMTLVTKGHMGNATDWVPPVTWHSFFSTLASLYFMRISRLISFHLFPVVVPGLGLLLLALSFLGVLRLRAGSERRATLWAMLIVALLPPVLILAISIAKPLWMPRYVMWAAVPFFILAGLGVTRLPRPRLQLAATVAVGLLAAINLAPYYHAETKPRWDLAAQELMRAVQPGDIVLVPDRGPIAIMDFFLGRDGQRIPDDLWTRDVFAAAAHLEAGGRVWVVAGKVGQADHTPRKSFDRITSPLGTPVRTVAVGDLITLKLYDRLPDDDLIAQGPAGHAQTAGF
ncbi:glycosyltransferase family 39 protein [Acidisoma sp. 7E03]